MKSKKMDKNLSLKRETVANLSDREKKKVRGGYDKCTKDNRTSCPCATRTCM